MSMKTDELIKLVYPEERIVTRSMIMIWHSDCVANREIEAHTSDLQTAIRDLENLGHITVGAA